MPRIESSRNRAAPADLHLRGCSCSFECRLIDPTGIADGVNAGLYALQGDWTNAGISLAGALLPYGGDALKGTRLVKGLIKSADGFSAAAGLGRASTSRVFSAAASGLSGATIGAGSGFAYGSIDGLISSGTWSGAWDRGLAGARFGAIQGGVGGAVRGLVNPYICFVAGTRVVVDLYPDSISSAEAPEFAFARSRNETLADASVALVSPQRYITVPVEELVARGGGEMGDGGGQAVLTRDEHDREAPLIRGRIVRTYERTAYHLQVLTLRDADGHEQTLRVTDEHLFYRGEGLRNSAGWAPARLLAAGDEIVGEGGTLTVVANEGETHAQGVKVYNLEVEQNHTYFVLAEHAPADADAARVHNANYTVGTATPLRPTHYSVLYETEILQETLAARSRYAHFKEANQNLLRDVKGGSQLDNALETMLPGYRSRISGRKGDALGVSPDVEATWHHVPDSSKMQLVLRYQHEQNKSQTSRLFQELFHPGGREGYATGAQQ